MATAEIQVRHKPWSFRDDGRVVEGTVVGVRHAKTHEAGAATFPVLDVDVVGGGTRAVFCGSRFLRLAVERWLSGCGPCDSIRIERSPELVVSRGGRTYWRWEVS